MTKLINKKSFVFFLTILQASLSFAQTEFRWKTLAGGQGGAGQRDGMGANARFFGPTAIARDAGGNFYVADSLNHSIRKISSTGEVTTLAGTLGVPGKTDGTGTSARFDRPSGIVVTAAGLIYVSDTANNTIRQVTLDGEVTTFAGTAGQFGVDDGFGASARFNSPKGLAIGSDGGIYVADSRNHTIRHITISGQVTTLAGVPGEAGFLNGPALNARFDTPNALAVATDGSVVLVDSGNYMVRKIAPDDEVTTISGTGSYGYHDEPASFGWMTGIAIKDSGAILICDFGNRVIREIGVNLSVTTHPSSFDEFGGFNFRSPTGICFLPNGDFVVVDHDHHIVSSVAPTTNTVTTIAGKLAGPGSNDGQSIDAGFQYPNGVAIDSAGNTYVADTSNHTIRKITPAGLVTTLAGAAGEPDFVDGPASIARFRAPTGVAVDGIGNIYVADQGNSAVRKITPSGETTTLAGAGYSGWADGIGSAAFFSYPKGVAVDVAGNVYVADTDNSIIRKVTPSGHVTTIAGKAKEWGYEDNVGELARFSDPTGITIDSAGNLFVADGSNYVVRKITPTTVVSTIAGVANSPGSNDGVALKSRFNRPTGVAVDEAGNIYVADGGDPYFEVSDSLGNSVVRRIAAQGVVTTIGGIPGKHDWWDDDGQLAAFYAPSAIAVNNSGLISLADTYNHRIASGTSPPIQPEIEIVREDGTLVTGFDQLTTLFGPLSLGQSATQTFTIYNLGQLPLTGLIATMSGTGSADYTLMGSLVNSLAPGASTTFSITFTPSVSGEREAQVTVVADQVNDSIIALLGNGSPEIEVEIEVFDDYFYDFLPLVDGEESVDFGGVVVGQSYQRWFSIRNDGRGLLTGISTSKTGSGDFVITALEKTVLKPGESTGFSVKFTPSQTGAQTCALSITSDDADESPFDIALTGHGLAPEPDISLYENSRGTIADGVGETYFGNVASGDNKIVNYYIYNDGTGPLTVQAINLVGPNSGLFSVSDPSETVIPIDGQASFTVTFAPTSVGDFTAGIQIVSDDPDESPFDIALSGVGAATSTLTGSTASGATWRRPTGGLPPNGLSSSATATRYQVIPFSVTVGGSYDFRSTTSWDNFMLLYRDSFDPLNQLANVIVGNDDFGSRSAGFSDIQLEMGVTYFLVNTGYSNTNSGNYLVEILGQGTVPQTEIEVEITGGSPLVDGTSAVNAGYALVGAGPSNVSMTIRNIGTSTLSGLVTSVTGTNATDFVVDAPGATSLPPGGSTTFAINFNASTIGSRVASLAIASNDADENPFNISLTGIGVTEVPAPVMQPASQPISAATQVTIASLIAGAEVRYTLDGSTPTLSSPRYTSQLTVQPGTRVRAIAFLTGWPASDFAESFYTNATSVPVALNGLITWLSADKGLSVTASGEVGRWEDLSGSGNHAEQTSPSRQPRTQGAAFGSLPAIRFDGVDDSLSAPSSQVVGKPSTYFLVTRRQSGTLGIAMQSASGTGGVIFGPYSSSEGGYYAHGWVKNGLVPAVGQADLWSASNTSSESRLFVNGEERTLDSSPTGNLGRLHLGGANGAWNRPGNNDVAEVLIYNRSLSEAERKEIEGYLAIRYGLFTPVVAAPTIALAQPHGDSPTSVTLAVETSEAQIRYTLDGTDPTDTSPLYAATPLTVAPGTTIKAKAFRANWTSSATSSGFYAPTSSLEISQNGLLVWLRADRGLTLDASGRLVRWDSVTVPTGFVTQGAQSQQPNVTGNVIASRPVVRFDGVNDSLLGPADQDIARPSTIFVVFQRQAGAYGGVLQSASGTGGVILGPYGGGEGGYHANNWVRDLGTVPLAQPLLYSAVNTSDQSRFFAQGEERTHNPQYIGNLGRISLGGVDGAWFDPGNNDVAEVIVYDRALSDGERQDVEAYLGARYALFTNVTSAPVISLPSSSGDADTAATLTAGTLNAAIRFTTDGSDPTNGSTLYSGPVTVSPGTTIKAKAFRSGWQDSAVASAYYAPQTGSEISRQGLRVWLRADRDLTLDSTGHVVKWSGVGADTEGVAQFGSAQRPMLISNALGGRPVVRFDGIDDSLLGPATQRITRPSTFFTVYQRQSGTYGSLLQSRQGTGTVILGPYGSNQSGYHAENWVGLEASVPIGVPQLFVGVNRLGSSAFYNEGVEATDNPLYSGLLGQISLGGTDGAWTDPGKNDLAELIVYDRTLSDGERQLVEAYLSQRYGFAISQPTLAPRISPSGGLFTAPVAVNLVSENVSAQIRYTTDGSQPTLNSSLYFGQPITVSSSGQIKAVAFLNGQASTTTNAEYIIDATIQTPPHREQLALWLRGDRGLTATSGSVDDWLDLSGSGSRASQTTTAAKPTVFDDVDFSTRWVNFDGTDDFLQLPPGFEDFSQGMTIVLVTKPAAVTSWARFLDFGNGSPQNNLVLARNGSSNTFAYLNFANGSQQYQVNASNAIALDTKTIFSIVQQSTGEMELRKNLLPIATGQIPLPDNTLRFRNYIGKSNWGGDGFFSGRIAEVLIYRTALDAESLQDIESELSIRYGVDAPIAQTPLASTPGGVFAEPMTVTLSSPTEGAVIRYTLDGSLPSSQSPVYSAPLTFSTNTVLRARAYMIGMNPSVPLTQSYLIGGSAGSGDGLLGAYYPNLSVSGSSYRRVDQTVGFDWGGSAPAPDTPSDNFSVEWTGELEARYTARYFIHSQTDDGVRLWLDLNRNGTFESGEQLIEDWTNHGSIFPWLSHTIERTSAAVDLQSGLRYRARMTYFDSGGSAVARLLWSAPGVTKEIIPTSQLYSLSALQDTALMPVADVAPGAFTSPQVVTLTSATSDAQIYYTLDGSEPTQTSIPYIAPIQLGVTATLKAITFKNGFFSSRVFSGSYIVDNEGPVISNLRYNNVPVSAGLLITDSGTFRVDAVDNHGVARVEFYTRQGSGPALKFGEDTNPANGYTATLSIAQLPDGPCTIVIVARDIAGAATNLELQAQIELALPAAPVLSEPMDGLIVGEPRVTVRGSCNPMVRINVYRDGTLIAAQVAPNSAGDFAVVISLIEGSNAIAVRSVNRAGESAEAGPRAAVYKREFPQLSVVLNEIAANEGAAVDGQVTISVAPTQPLTVPLTSNLPGRLSVTPSVTISAGATQAAFQVRSLQNETIENMLTATITAAGPGLQTGAATLKLLDDDWPVIGLTLDSTWIRENVGAQATFGTVTLDTARSTPLVVRLSSSRTTDAQVPATVTIPGGQTSVRFPIAAIDESIRDGHQNAMIRAWVTESAAGQIVSEAPPRTLQVQDNETPSVEVVLDRRVLVEGGRIENGVLLRLPTVATVATSVSLSATPLAQVSLPATVSIASGQQEARCTVQALADGKNESYQEVQIYASATGLTTGAATLFLTDTPKPELTIGELQLPSNGDSGSGITIGYRLYNEGDAVVTGRRADRIWLSSDSVIGDDRLVAQSIVTTDIAAGAYLDLSESISLPFIEGDFFLLVETDVDNDIIEASESNNSKLSATPIHLSAGYTATVSAAFDRYPVGSAISFTGSATRVGGLPAGGELVNIEIRVQDSLRTVSARTALNGTFSYTWRPLASECGSYTIAATHPAMSGATAQDTFAIVGIKVPAPSAVTFTEGDNGSTTLQLSNPAGYVLHGLQAQLETPVPGLNVGVDFPSGNTLTGTGTLPLSVQITAGSGVIGVKEVVILITSTEGITTRIIVPVRIEALVPVFQIEPAQIDTTVLRGTQKTVLMRVTNIGRGTASPLKVLLPKLDWMTLSSPAELPSLAAGESFDINLTLTPPSTAPLTLYTGNLALQCPQTRNRSIPLSIRTISDARGTLAIEAVDEFFFFGEGQPHLEGARVEVRDAITNAAVGPAQTTTAGGIVTFPDLMEGHYAVEVTADDHQRFTSTYLVEAGRVNQKRVFLTRNLVNYTWTVRETEVQDRYRITVKSTFETNVPAPVVTVTPGAIDIGDLTEVGQQKQIDMVIENHGFIAAQQGKFRFSDHPYYSLTPLISDLGIIPAKSKITIPLVIRRIAGPAAQVLTAARDRSMESSAAASIPCGLWAGLDWQYECGGEDVKKSSPVAVNGVAGGGGCGWPIRPGGPLSGGGVFGGSGPGISGLGFARASPCDNDDGDDDDDCKLEFCGQGSASIEWGSLGNKIKARINAILPPPWKVGEISFKFGGTGEACVCCPKDGGFGIKASGEVKASISVEVLYGQEVGLKDREWDVKIGPWREIEIENATVFAGIKVEFGGDVTLSLSKECQNEWDLCGQGSLNLKASGGGTVEGDIEFEDDKGKEYRGEIEGAAEVVGFGEIWIKAPCDGKDWQVGGCASVGLNFGLTATAKVGTVVEAEFGLSAEVELAKAGTCLDDPAPQNKTNLRRLAASTMATATVSDFDSYPADQFIRSDEAIARDLGFQNPQSSVCAKVKLQLDQDLVLTRQGFEASLEINNQQDTSLTNVGFTVDIRDSANQPANDRFSIRQAMLQGVTSMDGTGQIAPNTKGRATWIIVPTDDAAPVTGITYFVGGQISYTEKGRTLTIPTALAPIEVRPNAGLVAKYFHQRDVFSDDPHTDAIEPIQPYFLGMLLQNTGEGEARNMTLTSGQPKIVDNEKGLLIDFRITDSSVNGTPAKPSLTMDFGDLAPQSTKVGVWSMESTLHGLFIDYDATFEHLDGNGDPRLSLLKSVEIHEMNHLLEIGGSYADNLADFLCNDVPDANDFPDTLHLSDGSQHPVSLITQAQVGGTVSASNLQVQLNVTMPAGFGYLRLADPGNGQFKLVGVTRQDGAIIPVGKNVWQTDRTFLGMGLRPRYENMLHFLDVGGTGVYTLTYAVHQPDAIPPVSHISALPAQSPDQFALSWSGTDAAGIRYFDIYMRENAGAWTLWRSATNATAAVFEGTTGSTYSFYSLATDTTGNREAKAAAAETTTFVDGSNGSPIITAQPPVQVLEGQTLAITIQATDNDSPLAYRLVGNAPGGMTVDDQGRLRWPTTEPDGGTTRSITVEVTDNGLPQRSSQLTFDVTVNEDNAAPLIGAVETQTISAGETALVVLRATDADAPEQTLTWSLLPDSSEGMTVGATDGLLLYRSPYSRTGGTAVAKIAVTDDGTPAQTTTIDVNFILTAGSTSNRPPQALVAPDLVLIRGTTSAEVNLNSIFSDPDAADDIANYAILSNSNPGLVTGAVALPSQGKLLLTIDADSIGAGLLTLEATDHGGLRAQNALTVHVVDEGDDDGDGLLNNEEYLAHTDPANPDSDGDGYRDGTEVSLGTNPALASSNLAAYYIAENESPTTLATVAMKRLPAGVMKNSVAGGASTTMTLAWMGTYEFTNRQWAAVLQYALKQMPGALTITGTGPTAEVRHNGMLVCTLPTHLATASGGLASDEVTLDARSLTFFVPQTIADHPARDITWYGAYLATRVLNESNGYADKCLAGTWTYDFTKPGYFIPRDMDWEWAARSGTSALAYPTGAAVPTLLQANFNTATGTPKKTGSYKANALGMFDLGGNVSEWVFDSHPTDTSLGWARGGAWPDATTALRNNTRTALAREGVTSTMGFRVALTDERKPLVQTPPTSLLVMTNRPIELAVTATGTPPLAYQWLKNGKAIVGKTQPMFRLPSAILGDAATYTVKVTNALGTVTSAAATVGVVETSDIALAAPLKGKAVFPARAAGTGLVYQWRDANGNLTELAGKRTGVAKASLTLSNLVNTDSGPYTCFITGPGGTGSITSGPVNLAVLSIPAMESPVATTIAGVVSGTINLDFNASGSPAKFIIVGRPPGMTFNETTGLLYGKPTKAGIYKIKVSANNAAGTSGTVEVTLNVTDLPSAIKGSYVGLIARDVATNEGQGARVEMSVTALGTLSGKLFIGASNYPFTGALDTVLDSGGALLPPTATVAVVRKGLRSVSVQMTLGLTDDLMTGFASATGGTALLTGYRIVWDKVRLVTPYLSAYTALLDLAPGQTDSKIPQGIGYQTLAVAPSGVGQWVGRLADGTATTFSVAVGPTGQTFNYQSLYGGKGTLMGTTILAPDIANAGRRVLASQDWTWTKTGPASSTDRYYRDGFGVPTPVSLILDGGTYVKPATNVPVIVFGTGATNARLSFSGGGLSDWNLPFFWPMNNVPAMPKTSNPNAVALSFVTSTGIVTGSFKVTDTVAGKPYLRTVNYAGVIVQRLRSGAGHFLIPVLPNSTATPPITTTNAPYRSGLMQLSPSP